MHSLNSFFKNKMLFVAIGIGITLFHLNIFSELLTLPFKGDEWYYGDYIDLKTIKYWTYKSFGHPPIWLFLHSFLYKLFGVTPLVSHILGLGISLSFILFFYSYISRKANVFLGSFFVYLIYNHLYFLRYAEHNHPIIVSAWFGVLSLYYYHKDNSKLSLVFTFFSIHIRESLLSIFFGFIYGKKIKVAFKHIAISMIPFISFYIWYYFLRKSLLLNGQVLHKIRQNEEVLTFKVMHVLEFVYAFFIADNAPFFILCLIMYLVSRYKKMTIVIPKLSKALAISALIHFIFFSLYTEHIPRDHFVSSLFMYCSLFLIIIENKLYTSIYSHLTILIFLLATGKNFAWQLEYKAKLIKEHKYAVKIKKDAIIEIEKIIARIPDLKIMSEAIMARAIRYPYMGYVNKRNLKVVAPYHYPRVKPQLLLDDSKIMHFENYSQTKSILKGNEYILYKSIGEKEDLTLDIYVLRDFDLD
jgi:hypothetical protein